MTSTRRYACVLASCAALIAAACGGEPTDTTEAPPEIGISAAPAGQPIRGSRVLASREATRTMSEIVRLRSSAKVREPRVVHTHRGPPTYDHPDAKENIGETREAPQEFPEAAPTPAGP